jgi:hypothetical protein
MLKPGEKLSPPEPKQNKVVTEKTIPSKTIKSEFDGDTQSEIPVTIKVHEDNQTEDSTPKVTKKVIEQDEVTQPAQSSDTDQSSIKVMNPAKKSIINGKIVPFEIANSNESFVKPN